MSSETPHVIFAGGGTGGHLFPGLAVAGALRQAVPSAEITFCGTGSAFEREHVARAGFAYVALRARPLPRSLTSLARFLWDQPQALWAARGLLARRPTAAVVGLGGYASVSVVRMAQRRNVPVVLLEQNLIPGRATRWLARRGTIICAAFAESRSYFRGSVSFLTTGNPVRAEIASLALGDRVPAPAGRRYWIGARAPVPSVSSVAGQGSEIKGQGSGVGGRGVTEKTRLPSVGSPTSNLRTLLVLGGSQGAHSLNLAVPKALAGLRAAARDWRVLHQTGQADWRDVTKYYRATPFSFEVAPFFNDMPGVYREADLIVCRAGGTTLAEVACAGVPAVLIPYPHAAHDHQRYNAGWYARHDAARLVEDPPDAECLGEALHQTLSELLYNDAVLRRMAGRMRNLAKPHATAAVVDVLSGVVRGEGSGVGGQDCSS